MHDTAFHIGTLAMNVYADLKTAAVLEVGSQAVNGALRDNALPTTNYVGIDIEAGNGVDIVVEPGNPLPVDNDSFDLVIASSVFEHDSCFWVTFLEMCRAAKEGGYIYINVPSNGPVHRFPQDIWRFYPDSGKALVQWAISQGQQVSLVESFVAEREGDVWNDFVAVFRKGRFTEAAPQMFLHQYVPCSNVLTWKSKEIANRRDETEDMVLLAEAAKQRDSLVEQVSQLTANLAETAERGEQYCAEVLLLTEKLTESEQVCAALRLRENELRQRQEEIEQARSERDDLRSRLTGLEIKLTESSERYERAQAELESARAAVEASDTKLSERGQELAKVTELLHARETELKTEKSAAKVRLGERLREITMLNSILAEREAQASRSHGEAAWLLEATSVLATGSTTPKGRLLALLPAFLQQKRHRRLLKRMGLFDSEAYLAANPDVAAQGEDPLTHYLRHGIKENRRRG